MAAIAKKFGVSPSLVTRWQKQAEGQLPRVFEAKKSVVELQRELVELEKEYRWLKAKYDGYLETLGEERSTGKK